MKKIFHPSSVHRFVIGFLLISALAGQYPIKAQVGEGDRENWHDQIYRKLFFDYHNHQDNWGLGTDFDA